jgi:hypothetical protein
MLNFDARTPNYVVGSILNFPRPQAGLISSSVASLLGRMLNFVGLRLRFVFDGQKAGTGMKGCTAYGMGQAVWKTRNQI